MNEDRNTEHFNEAEAGALASGAGYNAFKSWYREEFGDELAQLTPAEEQELLESAKLPNGDPFSTEMLERLQQEQMETKEIAEDEEIVEWTPKEIQQLEADALDAQMEMGDPIIDPEAIQLREFAEAQDVPWAEATTLGDESAVSAVSEMGLPVAILTMIAYGAYALSRPVDVDITKLSHPASYYTEYAERLDADKTITTISANDRYELGKLILKAQKQEQLYRRSIGYANRFNEIYKRDILQDRDEFISARAPQLYNHAFVQGQYSSNAVLAGDASSHIAHPRGTGKIGDFGTADSAIEAHRYDQVLRDPDFRFEYDESVLEWVEDELSSQWQSENRESQRRAQAAAYYRAHVTEYGAKDIQDVIDLHPDLIGSTATAPTNEMSSQQINSIAAFLRNLDRAIERESLVVGVPQQNIECESRLDGNGEDLRSFDPKICLRMAKWSSLAYSVEDASVVEGYDVDVVEDGLRGTFCAIASNSATRTIVLAFRGSRQSSTVDWIMNFDFFHAGYDDPNTFGIHTRIHDGYYRSILRVKDKIDNIVKDRLLSMPTAQIYVCGHSKGGGEAYVYTMLNKSFDFAGIYTFGAPRVFDENGAKEWDKRYADISWRIVNDYDTIAKLPPKWAGYAHCRKQVRFHNHKQYDLIDGDIDTDKSYFNWKKAKGFTLAKVEKKVVSFGEDTLMAMMTDNAFEAGISTANAVKFVKKEADISVDGVIGDMKQQHGIQSYIYNAENVADDDFNDTDESSDVDDDLDGL